MALTRANLPTNTPTRAAPIDTALTFNLNGSGGTPFTASGWVTGAATSFITVPIGRFQGSWNLQVYAANVASGNEFYQFFLLGSNDKIFAAGNCDLLGAYDIAATAALRLGDPAGQAAAWPGIFSGRSAAQYSIPMSNERDVFTFEFVNLYVQMGGTSPSITVDSWLSPWTGQKY
jgi:hypothetical protein